MKPDLTLLAIFAHPDDETFRAGGTLALLTQLGVTVNLLCATRGEMGIPDVAPKQAGIIRQQELVCACRALGISPPQFLGYTDGTLPQVDEKEAIAQLAKNIRQLRPQVLLTWPPEGVSGHPDHITISRWVGQAFELAADPKTDLGSSYERLPPYAVSELYHIVIPHSMVRQLKMPSLFSVPDRAITHTIKVSKVAAIKMKAIYCHHSQLNRSPIMNAPPEHQQMFLETEFFQRVIFREQTAGQTASGLFERLLLSSKG